MTSSIRDKLKINASDLLPLNERLIYGSLTGYGEDGPDSHRTAFDTMAWWARSGLMDIVRPSDNSTPGMPPIGMGDQPTGVSLFASIMTALYRREKTGKGGEVNTSLMANGAWSNGSFIQAALFDADFPDKKTDALKVKDFINKSVKKFLDQKNSLLDGKSLMDVMPSSSVLLKDKLTFKTGK